MSATTGVILTQVSFGDNGLEVTYLETREQSPQVGMIRTIMFEVTEDMQAALEDVLDTIEGFVDDALVKLRNPQVRIPSAREVARNVGRESYESE